MNADPIDIDPVAAACLVEFPATGPLSIRSIPGAQESVWLLAELGISARWRPDPGLPAAPYAYIALGFRLHIAWFPLDRWVRITENTACGKEFRADRERLLGVQYAPCVIGLCSDCEILWKIRHAW